MTPPKHPRAPVRASTPGAQLPVLLLALTGAMLLAFALGYLPRERAAFLRDTESDLRDRAAMRGFAVQAWVIDELGDVHTVAGYEDVRALGRERAAGAPGGPGPSAAVSAALESFAHAQDLDALVVLDSLGEVRARSSATFAVGPGAGAFARAVWASDGDSTDFVRGADGRPWVAFAQVERDPRDGRGVVVMALEDPGRWLYRLLRVAGSIAPSTEAMLLRLEGDGVRVLSPRRQDPDAALNQRIPVDLDDPVVAAAIAGRDTVGRARDVDGTRVVVAVHSIDDTPWALVIRASEREVLAPFHRRMWELGLGLGLVALCLMGLALALEWGRRRAREAERANEHARLAALFERADDPVLFIEEDGRIRDATRRAEEFYGVPEGGLNGRSAVDSLRVPEERAAGAEQFARILREGRAVFETTHLAAGGRPVPVEISSRRVEVEGGRLVVSVVRDISERRRADEQLRKLSRAVESNPAGIVITDTQGVIEYVNPAFASITGHPADELIGRDPSVLKSGETPDEIYRDLWRTISAGQEWRGELVNHRRDGSQYWAELSISPLRDEVGRVSHYVGIQEDVSERKRAQEVLRTTQMQLLQAQKMETVGRLAGGVAHDFNNLLTIIHGYGELLLVPLPPGSDDRAKVEEILKAASRAAQLTRQLLAFGRRQVLEPRVLDLRVAIDDAERMLRRVIGEDIGLEVERPAALGRVKADPGQIEQVLLNLVVNARDAMPDGGRLTLALSDVELDEEAPDVSEPVTPGRYVLLAVTDTGHGMDDDVRAHLFEPFFTTKEVGKGTGLGLATVYGIVKQSGGFVGVETAPGSGTSFRIYLPQVDEPLPGPPPLPSPGDRPGRGERVLLVEDDDSVRGLAWALLDESGFHVIAASDGETALALAEREPGRIDLLVTDVVMPGMSGIDLARRLRERHPGLPVLLVSGYSDDAAARAATLGAGVRFLQKPFNAHALGEAVRDSLRGV